MPVKEPTKRKSPAAHLASREELMLALPPADITLQQDEEWCVVELDGEWRHIRMHDYDELFAVPGLYERLLYDILKCDSPATLRALLVDGMSHAGFDPADLRVLDLGAGNGMVGEELYNIGARHIVGVDIIEAAKDATERDRPGMYDDYFIYDMTDLSPEQQSKLLDHKFNCLTCVAALGFGDIPTEAFIGAYNVVEKNGWLAFNIKAEFLETGHESGFARLIRELVSDQKIEIHKVKRYQHRIGTDGTPLDYVAMVGRKLEDS